MTPKSRKSSIFLLERVTEQLFDKIEKGESLSDTDLRKVAHFIQQLEEDINALNGKQCGLGQEALQIFRKHTPRLTYAQIGSTMSYLRQTFSGLDSKEFIQKLQDEIKLARKRYRFNDETYALFLDYISAFKSEKPMHERIPEFKEVVIDTVMPGYKVHTNLAKVVEEFDGSFDRFLTSHPTTDPVYAHAQRYNQVEARYGIKTREVEKILDNRLNKPDLTTALPGLANKRHNL